MQVLREPEGGTVTALEFASGRRIYSLSSNPNALAGKRGHVKLDEFALHHDQRLLYRVAKPVTMWGGQLCIISTHRGAQSVFNEILRDIREQGNPMGWSLHSVPLERAVEQGIVERINDKRGTAETREAFLRRLRAECLDERQWLQEYCCVPCDTNEEFLKHELIAGCQERDCLKDFEYLERCANPVYLGVDVARKKDLCVIDAGESIGDVVWDRLRIELQDQTFDRIEAELYRLLELDSVHRACIDATGLGLQLAERARQRFGWKAEPVVFTAAVKEELAFGFKGDLERRQVRLADDAPLQRDLLSLRKETTTSGNLRFGGSSEDGHCDRFWAKALRQHAARHPMGPAAMVC
jgi:phage FluMu gp28-like protein